MGNARSYLVHDHRIREWHQHEYVRFDLQQAPLRFSLDLSRVECGCTSGRRSKSARRQLYLCGAPACARSFMHGCAPARLHTGLACIYLVAMGDPDRSGSN